MHSHATARYRWHTIRGDETPNIIAAIDIGADIDAVWRLAQDPLARVRWDLWFSRITPTDALDNDGYRFRPDGALHLSLDTQHFKEGPAMFRFPMLLGGRPDLKESFDDDDRRKSCARFALPPMRLGRRRPPTTRQSTTAQHVTTAGYGRASGHKKPFRTRSLHYGVVPAS